MAHVAARTGLKVVSATIPARRAHLIDALTAWPHAHPDRRPVQVTVRQSSDRHYHCIPILMFWRAGTLPAPGGGTG